MCVTKSVLLHVVKLHIEQDKLFALTFSGLSAGVVLLNPDSFRLLDLVDYDEINKQTLIWSKTVQKPSIRRVGNHIFALC